MWAVTADGTPRPDETTSIPTSAAALVVMLYDELRKLAAARLRVMAPGQTLQATALVNEAYLRIEARGEKLWQGRRHFFGAAARAMHDILVDRARAKHRLKRGEGVRPANLDDEHVAAAQALPEPEFDMLALAEALERLALEHPRCHELVMLRYFAGLEYADIAAMFGVSERTVGRDWVFARSWLKDALQ